MEEIWSIVGDTDKTYSVSSLGRVRREAGETWVNGKPRRSDAKEEKLLTFVDSAGYSRVNLQLSNRRTLVLVHRLVAIAFIPNPGTKPQVNHIDSNRKNNHVNNLEWVTAKENYEHACSVGRMPTPPPPPQWPKGKSRLAVEQLEEISKLLSEGRTVTQIAEEVGVHRTTISRIFPKRIGERRTTPSQKIDALLKDILENPGLTKREYAARNGLGLGVVVRNTPPTRASSPRGKYKK